MTNKQDKSSPTRVQADKQAEDPLQEIARMRKDEQEEIAEDMKKMQEMRTQHVKNINTILKRH
jgi:hypothetical protein